MNLTSELRSKFSLFLFTEDLDQSTDLRGHLAVSGYEVFMFRDQDMVIDRVRQAAPHVLIFEIEALQTTLSEFVEKVLEANSEVLFLPLVSASQALALNEYREYNFAGLVTKGEERDLRLLWQVDQICSELYFQYQNEQLFDQKAELEKKLEVRESELKNIEKKNIQMGSIESFDSNRELKFYESARSKEELLDAYLKQMEQKYLRKNQKLQALVLKFLPTVQSFVATLSLNLDLEKLKGIGARLEKEESENITAMLNSGALPVQLKQLLDQGLKISGYVCKALFVPGAPEALLIFWVEGAEIQSSEFENEFSFFQLCYQNLHLVRRLQELDLRDPVTDFEGHDYYFKRLDEEIARARRLQKPISVVKIAVDHLPEIEQAYGISNRNAIFRTIATLIKRSSRINDDCCRTEDNEISLILPHSARKGAAIRAERIRRLVENHSFNLSGHRVTLACGVSEYPSLCNSSEELEKTALQALNFIQEKGGNKVCLYRARTDFKPDFDVPPL